VAFPVERHTTEETIPMKQTWYGHSAFRIEAGEAKILIDPFLSDNPSRDNGWSGYVTGKNSTQGGDR
jgi:L-ascorbate metabolism protein UlaG (beta-lactamase superfamily)